MSASRDISTFPQEDTRRVFYAQNYEWALKMTFRYLGSYEAAVATVHHTFLNLFRSAEQGIVKAIFIKAAVDAALQREAQDTIAVRAAHAQTYLRDLAVWVGDGANSSEYRNAIAQLLLLPLLPRLAYNICIIDGCSDTEAAGLLGISERQLAGHVQKARTLLRNAMG